MNCARTVAKFLTWCCTCIVLTCPLTVRVVRSGKVSPPRVASLRSCKLIRAVVCLSLMRFLRFVCRLPDHEIIASIFIASIRPSNRPIVDNEQAWYFQQIEIFTFHYNFWIFPNYNREKRRKKEKKSQEEIDDINVDHDCAWSQKRLGSRNRKNIVSQ